MVKRIIEIDDKWIKYLNENGCHNPFELAITNGVGIPNFRESGCGMTIDEIIKDFKEAIDNITSYGYTTNHSDALSKGIEIIHKYQKIEQIVNHWSCCGNPVDSIIAISEVVEDGKIKD